MSGHYRAFKVRTPTARDYYTVVNTEYDVLPTADCYLRSLRFGSDAAESTTAAYARAIALYHNWCEQLGLDWRCATRHWSRFLLWLRGPEEEGQATLINPRRGAKRVNAILCAVRSYLNFQAANGEIDPKTLNILYVTPADQRTRAASNQHSISIVRHKLKEPKRRPSAATPEEIAELLKAARDCRDRVIIMLAWRAGLRRGEISGLRSDDIHLLPDSNRIGCTFGGPHIHVVRRQNENGAWAKSRNPRIVPCDEYLTMTITQYIQARIEFAPRNSSQFLVVSLGKDHPGTPTTPKRINKIFDRLNNNCHLERKITPHMLRHSFATYAMSSDVPIDVLKELLGHASIQSTETYLHPPQERLREAVEAISSRLSQNYEER